MIDKKEKKGNVTIYYVSKDYDDSKLKNVINKKLKRSDINDIITDNADVYTTDGKLLLRFRKNVINNDNINDFYNNVINFAVMTTSNRGIASGSKKKNFRENPKIMSNIIGYFDKLSPKQNATIRNEGHKKLSISVRETRFLIDYPEKYKKLIPLVKQIDGFYKKLVPDNYAKQKKKANQTPFRIADTAFTTITTNVNYQTAVHTDKGDDDEGFGNLVVIEKGKYKGGETCFPQYGIGIDLRSNGIIFMDVHQAHGNLPIELEEKDAKRLSIVCYLRKNIWIQTKGKTKKFMEKHNSTMRKITRKNNNTKKQKK
jgi:hypothetical protein